jgi:hypothetical protein
MHRFLISLLIILSTDLLRAGSADEDLQRGRAGIYVQLARLSPPKATRNLVASNAFVSTVMLPLWWSVVEPSRGEFSTDAFRTEIDYWKRKGKRVVLQVTLYGQEPGDAQTPRWLYAQPDVQAISFAGGGSARGARIRVPAVWKGGFVDKYTEPLVKALADATDGDPTLAYIQIGLGHVGGTTAQPSKNGGIAFLGAGWTPAAWQDYCLRTADVYHAHFKRTPLLAIAEGLLVRDRANHGYEREVGLLVGALGHKGVSIIHSDIVDQIDKPRGTQEIARLIRDHLGSLLELAAAGKIRIGLGDDWPLWVPESRRQKGPTSGRDDSFLERALDAGFGGKNGIPETGMTIYYSQLPPALASNPSSTPDHAKENYYRPAVAKITSRTRDRLMENDRRIFGSP